MVILPLAVLMAVGPGCSWQKIPPPPTYEPKPPIPLVVGVEIDESHTSQIYGPQVVDRLRDMNVFQYVISPYSASTPVDAVLTLSIEGSWKTKKGSTLTSAILVGLTLGLLGPVLGPKMTGDHHVAASLVESGKPVVGYAYDVHTEIRRGLSADATVLQFKADEHQTQEIAVTLAGRLNDDREKITGVSTE